MLRRIHRTVVIVLALLAPLLAWADAALPTRQWPVSTPAEQNIDPRAILALHEELARPQYAVDCVIIVRHGYIVSEAYFAPFQRQYVHDLRSVTKTITGTLIGVALEQGRIAGPEQEVMPYFPAFRPHDRLQRRLTVAHLLDMRAGIAWREWPYDASSDVLRMAASGDWVRYILDRPMAGPPGAAFHYSGAAPHLLSALLRQATGQDTLAYARQHLFAPLGISDVLWRADPQGNADGESGLSMRPGDLAKIGLLYLRAGKWGGKRLLPAWWVGRVLDQSRPHGLSLRGGLPPNYSAMWWVAPGLPMAAAIGRHAQFLVLLPRQDMVVVVNAKAPDAQAEGINIGQLLATTLLPGVDRAALPAAGKAQAALTDRLAALTRETPLAAGSAPSIARRVTGRTYKFESNRLGLSSMTIQFRPDRQGQLSTEWQTGAGTIRIELPFGSDGRYVMSGMTPLGEYASRGVWKDSSSLLVETEAPVNSVATQLLMRFKNDTLHLTMTDGDGLNVSVQGRAQ